MPKLSFVTTCKGRLEFLKQTLPRMVAQPDSDVVVVDYSCPESSADWVCTNYPEVQIVREPGQPRFNLAKARNLGASQARGDWICFCDADVLLAADFVNRMAPTLELGHYYHPDPAIDWGLCGTVIVSRRDYNRIGGYDDVYEGWSEEDMDFYRSLELYGVGRVQLSENLVQHISHDDNFRVRYFDNKDRFRNLALNRLYRTAKFDLMRLSGRPLPREFRESLYHQLRSDFFRAFDSKTSMTAEIKLAVPEPLPKGFDLARSIRYVVNRVQITEP